jgi:NAD(P)-dependent dehydrogenase (short-subunit alcohol dehydrogenase family)
VSDEAAIEALVARAMETFGRLDIMFNNAGIGGAVGPLEDVSVEDWDRTQAVCLRGVFLGMKHAAAPMRAAGGGSIISTSSIGGLQGSAGMFSYSAAKAAVVHLTRCAALEFARDRIRVNCIAPGGISTPILFGVGGNSKEEVESGLMRFQPYPHVGQPEDIANAALFLASDAATFITGHTLVVDGGATAGPKASAPKAGQNRRSRFTGPSFERAGGKAE